MHLFSFYRPIATAFTSFLFFSPVECNCIGRHYHKRDIAKCQPNKVHTAFTLLVNRILPDGPNAFFCHCRRVAIIFFFSSFILLQPLDMFFQHHRPQRVETKAATRRRLFFFHFLKEKPKNMKINHLRCVEY